MESETGRVVACIPAYREEGSIAAVVLGARRYVDEVMVCDDGSDDMTGSIAEELGATVLRHERNLGYGRALTTLFMESLEHGADIIVTLDADGQHDPSQIPDLIKALKETEADIAIGSRFLQEDQKTPEWRRRGIKLITDLTSNGENDITDAQSGFRAYTREALESLNLTEEGMGVSTEILLKAQNKGLKIAEAPIKVSYRQDSSTRNPVVHGLFVVLSTVKHLSMRHPLLFYGVPGVAAFGIAAFFWAWTLQIFSTQKRVVTNLALIALGSTLTGLILSTTAVILWVLISVVREKT